MNLFFPLPRVVVLLLPLWLLSGCQSGPDPANPADWWGTTVSVADRRYQDVWRAALGGPGPLLMGLDCRHEVRTSGNRLTGLVEVEMRMPNNRWATMARLYLSPAAAEAAEYRVQVTALEALLSPAMTRMDLEKHLATGLEPLLAGAPLPVPDCGRKSPTQAAARPQSPADADGDGVADSADRCPQTPPKAPVNATGCWTVPPVLFETGLSHLDAVARGALDGVARTLAAAPAVRLALEGHTDDQGSEVDNQRLSQARAQAVREYLTGQGSDAGRFDVSWHGESLPEADNATPDGQARNRRVTLTQAP
ncbi:MAG: OmpA family protein [Magnetococcales bacterium]|nr:OmpA family protein [Magnetococcales bacterium]